MKVPRLLRTLFTRADPATDHLAREAQRTAIEAGQASDRLMATLHDMLDRNDTLKLRRPNDAQKTTH